MMGFHRLACRVLLAGLVLLGACAGPSHHPRVERLPVPDLNQPSGPRIGAQLRQLRDSPKQCLAMLERTRDLATRPMPDEWKEERCGYVASAVLDRTIVPLDRPTRATCPVLAGLHLWLREVVAPAAQRHFGQPVRRVNSWGTYACRTRNSQPGARISEHATANAIDIPGFELADGTKVRVLEDWPGADERRRAFLREVMAGACRYFSVVLGPGSDPFHQNHFHLDMGPWPKCG